jgi:ubiquinone/menaquinone biosynthesis C-methylase UbiE
MRDNIDWKKVNRLIGAGLYSGLAKKLVDISHKDLARFGNINSMPGPKILEIGAGRGEHFQFVRKDFKEYAMTDISEWGKSEIQTILNLDTRISFEIQDIENLSYADNQFDRVIVSCVLIHVDQPFAALGELKRVTKKGGLISIYIAAEPGVILRLMRLLVSKRKMKELEVPYSLINALSHRNNAGGIIVMTKHVFKNSKIKINYHPFRIKSWNLSTHIIVNIIVN